MDFSAAGGEPGHGVFPADALPQRHRALQREPDDVIGAGHVRRPFCCRIHDGRTRRQRNTGRLKISGKQSTIKVISSISYTVYHICTA